MFNAVSIALRLLIFRAESFERATRNPVAAQKKVLFEYLSRNRNTEYGQKYNFASIRSFEGYQKTVPVTDCDKIRPYLDEITGGRLNVLTSDRPIFFGATSGTTNYPKYIPTTKFSEAKNKKLMELWTHYIARDHPDASSGKVLAFISPEVEGHTQSGIAYGAESGHTYRKLPAFIRHIYVLPYEVFEIKDYEARYYAILRISMEHDITNITTLNPNNILMLCRKIVLWQERMIEDIANGTLNKGFNIPDSIREKISAVLKPNRKRADELIRIVKEEGALLPKYFWPNLKLIECWKGGTMKLYLSELPDYFGDVPTRDIGYASTEARSSIPISDDGAGGVLAIQTNFYEFVPKDEAAKPDRRYLLCDQLETGKDYFIIVTTPSGLYRYDIDDIVRVRGWFNKTPLIEFVQKGLSSASLSGEKLYESQVNDALNNILARGKVPVEFFCACTEHRKGKAPRYVFLTEFQQNLSHAEKREFLKEMDDELRRQNREYDYGRQAEILAAPVLKAAASGEYERYRVKRLAEGAHDGQFKTPQLSSDPVFLNSFQIAETIE